MYYHHQHDVLLESECDALVGRGVNFEAATVKYYGESRSMTAIRNNDRFEFDDTLLAATLEGQLKTALGDAFPIQFEGRSFSKMGSHFRIYRYSPGQYFKTHRDGSYDDGESESEITVLFYLNDTQGGDTVLMPKGKSQDWAHIVIAPKKGSVLMFQHGMWHEGRPVEIGHKLVIRSDLFYLKA